MRAAPALLALLLACGGPLAAQDSAGLLEQARRYHDGRGVVQSYARAAELYRQAAEAGSDEARNALGRYYHEGLGVPEDRAEALRWFEAAAESGAPDHLFDLASALEAGAGGDPAILARAAGLYQRAAEAGHGDAAVSLGVLYQEGLGVDQDPARARALYEGPAGDGNARAQNNLGMLYVRGTGVAQDYARAADYFAAAAEQGLPQALTNLGVMYENGFGVPLDEARAAELYRMGGQGGGAPDAAMQGGFVYDARLTPPPGGEAGLAGLEQAAAAGDPVAQFQLGWLLLQAPSAGTDWGRAARLFAAAAERGLPAAMINLGQLYTLGRGVPQDYVLAQMWLLLAASGGAPGAEPPRAALAARMTPEQINEAQARATARRAGPPR